MTHRARAGAGGAQRAADVQKRKSVASSRRRRAARPCRRSAMAKKVDVSFMKMVNTDAEWNKEVRDGGAKQLCSAHTPPLPPTPARARRDCRRVTRRPLAACGSHRRLHGTMGCVRNGRPTFPKLLLRPRRDAGLEVCARVLRQGVGAQGLSEQVVFDVPVLSGPPPPPQTARARRSTPVPRSPRSCRGTCAEEARVCRLSCLSRRTAKRLTRLTAPTSRGSNCTSRRTRPRTIPKRCRCHAALARPREERKEAM